jgi:hypothetical protein
MRGFERASGGDERDGRLLGPLTPAAQLGERVGRRRIDALGQPGATPASCRVATNSSTGFVPCPIVETRIQRGG